MRHQRIFFTQLFAIVFVASCVFAEEAPKVKVAQKAADILLTIDSKSTDPAWDAGEKLFALGETARTVLEASLKDAPPAKKLAACYALLKLGAQRPATESLEKLILDEKTIARHRRQAVALLGKHGGSFAAAHIRKMLQIKNADEELRVELAKALWKLTHTDTAYEELHQIMEKGKTLNARAQATIALAQFGRFADVEPHLKKLAELPGDIGDSARNLLMLNEKVIADTSSDQFPSRLVNEIIRQIRDKYAPDETDKEEAEQLEARHLANEAARALLSSIDPFSDYLDEEDYKDMLEQINSSYGGIGAWVGMRDGRFTILTPMYNQPAFKAGLRSMDIVEKIDGKEIKDMRLNEIIKMLKGMPKTKVTATVWRRGWQKPRDFEIIRDKIKIPSVIAQLLPGDIGYVKLSSFNDNSASDLEKILVDFNKKSIKGLVLDLTNNPGGLLSAAVEVSSKFLGGGKLIVYSQGKPRVYRRQNYFAPESEPIYRGPLTVMVNGGSASASEIVSGALHDHERARLVGRKTFGKGSVQQLLPVLAMRGKTRIKLTIAKYYLPKGNCIHKKGIKPDVEVEEQEIPLTELEVRMKIRDSRQLEVWLEKNFSKHEKKYRELLEFDDYSPDNYPGFAEVFDGLVKKYPDGGLTKEIVRKEFRHALRRHLMNLHGEQYPADLEENSILQHAVFNLGELISGGLPDIPVYKALREKIEKEKKLAAAEKTPELNEQ